MEIRQIRHLTRGLTIAAGALIAVGLGLPASAIPSQNRLTGGATICLSSGAQRSIHEVVMFT
jgi:hypothetical protein